MRLQLKRLSERQADKSKDASQNQIGNGQSPGDVRTAITRESSKYTTQEAERGR